MPPGQGPQGPIDYASPADKPRTSGLAITALVLGILGLVSSCFLIGVVPGIVAIVLGIIGISQTSDPKVGGRGLAIGGLVTGILATLIVPVMAISILLPSLNRARETANRVKCASNMRQIGLATILYADSEPGGAFPPSFDELLLTQDITADVFVCPSTNDAAGTVPLGPGTLSYVWAGAGLTSRASAETPLIFEPLSNHTNDGSNVLFADAHVEFVQAGPYLDGLVQDALDEGRLTQEQADQILGVP